MNTRRRIFFRLAVVLGAGCFLITPLCAQESTNVSEPPLPKSPVESFRELLALAPQERKQALADRTPKAQEQILAKIDEYLSLAPEERDLRLRATELRWYLQPMMSAPSTNRSAQLAIVPLDLRKLVKDRIALWDRLPPATQKELLENDLTASYFAQFQASTPKQRTNLLAGISPERRAELEAGMARWQALSEAERRRTCERFEQFFELTPRQQEKALEKFPEAERQQMEVTLRIFESLPKDRREHCVRAFAKFASLSVEEREQFLKSAERWRLMSTEERNAWRDLVTKVPDWPPMPPDVPPPPPPELSPSPAPPLPPAATN